MHPTSKIIHLDRCEHVQTDGRSRGCPHPKHPQIYSVNKYKQNKINIRYRSDNKSIRVDRIHTTHSNIQAGAYIICNIISR